MLDRSGRNQSAVAGVGRNIRSQVGKRAVDLLAFDRAADDEVVRAPAVIAAVTVLNQSAAEVGSGEQRHVIGRSHGVHRRLKEGNRRCQLRQQIGLRRDLVRMRVVATHRHQEHLACGAERASNADDFGDHR